MTVGEGKGSRVEALSSDGEGETLRAGFERGSSLEADLERLQEL